MAQDSLHILVSQELFATAESSSYSGELDLSELVYGPDTYRFEAPLRYDVAITNTGDALLVTGTVTGSATTACGRCLDDVPVDVKGDVEGYFLLSELEEEADDEDAEDFEVLGEDNIIDLEPLLVSAVLVDLPTMPLCREDCKGLCPDCGVNLNDETCTCATKREQERAAFDEAKNPFAKLRELDLSNEAKDE